MRENVLKYMPLHIAKKIENMSDRFLKEIIEIRLRTKQPLQILTGKCEYFMSKSGRRIKTGSANEKVKNTYLVNKEDLKTAFMILSKNSIYALERQLAQGFITIPGGHRVGFTGEVITCDNKIEAIKNINSLNYRISTEKKGIGEKILRDIYCFQRDYIYNTLIIGAPLCGKTTLLRDVIRIISSGHAGLGIKAKKVGLVDERSEIAGAYQGIPQNNVGCRTDVLDNCPKAQGIMLLIRAMSPEVIAADELGSQDDIEAIKKALTAGVSLICTVHGSNLKELKKSSGMNMLIKENFFDRYIILSRRKGIGTVEKILDKNGREVNDLHAEDYRHTLDINIR